MSPRWRQTRYLPLAADVAGLALALGGLGLTLRQLAAGIGQPSDFTAYYLAARAHALGLDYYRRETLEALAAAAGLSGDLGPYLYPPLFAAALGPLAVLDYVLARWVWLGLSLGCLAAGLLLLRTAAGLRLGAGWRGPALAFVACFPPLADDLLKGQVTALLLLLLAGAWYAHRRERPYLAGTLVALAAWIKLAPALLLVYFALRRDWRGVAAGAVTTVGLLVLSLLAAGPAPHLSYFTQTVPTIGLQIGAAANVSLPGLVARLFAPGPLNAPLVPDAGLYLGGLALGLSGTTGAFVWVSLTQPGPAARDRLGYAFAIVTLLLLTPSSRAYTLVLALIPLAALFACFHEAGQPNWRVFDLLVVVLLLLSVPPDLRLDPLAAMQLGLQASPPPVLLALISALPTAGLVTLAIALLRASPADATRATGYGLRAAPAARVSE